MTASERDGALAGLGPAPEEVDRRFTAARTMAEAAGRLIMRYFRRDPATEVKDRGSLVTVADREAEELMRQRIGRQHPGDSVLGEEFGLDDRGGDWCWTLDPLDGTHNFVHGIPLFSVAVGVLYRREPVIGVILDPIRAETYAAARGRGARRNGEPIGIARGPLGPFSVLAVRHRFLRGRRAALLEQIATRKLRCLGSICLEMAYVAAGAIAAQAAGSARLWEVGAGAALIHEAGGLVRDLDNEGLFPLRDGIAALADRRLGTLAGSAEAIDELAAQLAKIPL